MKTLEQVVFLPPFMDWQLQLPEMVKKFEIKNFEKININKGLSIWIFVSLSSKVVTYRKK